MGEWVGVWVKDWTSFKPSGKRSQIFYLCHNKLSKNCEICLPQDSIETRTRYMRHDTKPWTWLLNLAIFIICHSTSKVITHLKNETRYCSVQRGTDCFCFEYEGSEIKLNDRSDTPSFVFFLQSVSCCSVLVWLSSLVWIPLLITCCCCCRCILFALQIQIWMRANFFSERLFFRITHFLSEWMSEWVH